MFELNSITFKDSETEKFVEVHIPDGHVEADEGFTKEDYAECSLYTGLLLSGGLKELELYHKLKSK